MAAALTVDMSSREAYADVGTSLEKSRNELQNMCNASADTHRTGKLNPPPPLRVNQLDADQLDYELSELLMAKFTRLFKAGTVERYRPEIEAALRGVTFLLSVYASGNTAGNKVQNLTLVERDGAALSRRTRMLYCVLHVLGNWAWLRGSRFALQNPWGGTNDDYHESTFYRNLRTAIRRLELAYQVATVANFAAFMVGGRYRTVLERILGIRMQYIRPIMMRQVSFEYMNRQLVWHGITEFLLFLVPLINTKRLSNLFASLTFGGRKDDQTLPASMCPVCRSTAVMPHVAQCGHTFCYYCVKTALDDDPSYPCPRCHKRVRDIRRWATDQRYVSERSE